MTAIGRKKDRNTHKYIYDTWKYISKKSNALFSRKYKNVNVRGRPCLSSDKRMVIRQAKEGEEWTKSKHLLACVWMKFRQSIMMSRKYAYDAVSEYTTVGLRCFCLVRRFGKYQSRSTCDHTFSYCGWIHPVLTRVLHLNLQQRYR